MRTYLKIMDKGHNPSVDEYDIARGFQLYNRSERFDLDLEYVNAHSFKILEIIEQEKSQLMSSKVSNNVGGVNRYG